jgi:hypothetical protein
MENDMNLQCKCAGRRRPNIALAIVGLCLLASGAPAQDGDVLEFKGTNSTVTPAFEVQAPWILDWRIYTDFPQSMSLEIALLDATTGMHDGQILQTKEMGTGVKLFEEGGSYKLRIDSDLARWQLLIKELTPEEAEQYTPRERDGVLGNEWFRTRKD